MHFSGCRGQIIVENCVFINPHDDAINIHGTFLQVEEIQGNRVSLRYCHHQTLGFPSFFKGDSVLFYDGETMLPMGELCLVQEANGPDEADLVRMEIILDDVPPLCKNKRLVLENRSWMPDVIIENNQFKQIPTRGVLVSTGGSVKIRNNCFQHIYMSCILISADANEWFESGPVIDVVITENTFKDCAQHAVLVKPTNQEFGEAKIHHNIRIEENTVIGLANPIFSIKSSDGVRIE